jgi:hypothetical protein
MDGSSHQAVFSQSLAMWPESNKLKVDKRRVFKYTTKSRHYGILAQIDSMSLVAGELYVQPHPLFPHLL